VKEPALQPFAPFIQCRIDGARAFVSQVTLGGWHSPRNSSVFNTSNVSGTVTLQ